MSLEATQSCLISDSESWTCLPGLADRTSVSRLIISSRTAGSIPACTCDAIRFYSESAPKSVNREEETLEVIEETRFGVNSFFVSLYVAPFDRDVIEAFSCLRPLPWFGGSISGKID